MGQPLVIPSDLYVSGRISCQYLTIPAETVSNDNFTTDTSKRLATTKQVHQHNRTHSQANTTATSETRVLAEVRGATGTLKGFTAGSIVPCTTGATITVDLRKNGTTVLTAVITLNGSSVAYVSQTGTFASTSLVQGDVLTAVITATVGSGTLGTGTFCTLVWDEDPT